MLGLTGVRVRLQGSKDVLPPCESKCFSHPEEVANEKVAFALEREREMHVNCDCIPLR